jgi:hypothetical protein
MAAVEGASSAGGSSGGGGMPGGLSAKQQKLFELRMRMVGGLSDQIGVYRFAHVCMQPRACRPGAAGETEQGPPRGLDAQLAICKVSGV